MKKIRDFFLTQQFAVFVVFGGIAAVVNLAVGRLLYGGDAPLMPYFWAVLVGALSGLLVNFLCNYHFNFSYRERTAREQFGTFLVVAAAGSLLTALLSWSGNVVAGRFLPDSFSWGGFSVSLRFLAHVAAIFLTTFYSFAGHKLFSFNAGLWARLKEPRTAMGMEEQA